jgi:hypothetical protein
MTFLSPVVSEATSTSVLGNTFDGLGSSFRHMARYKLAAGPMPGNDNNSHNTDSEG